MVVVGRDIGSVVAPDAPLMFYLTADPAAGAARRTAEMAGSTVQDTHQDLIRRDRLDSGRATAPLQMADDAHHIDTTAFTLDEVIDQVVALVRETAARVTDGS
jgi:cytidylate kinase